MRKTRTKKILSLILLLVLSAAIALSAFGCEDKKDDGSAVTTTTAPVDDTNVRGEGATSFTFTVVTKAGEEKTFTVKTDKTIVGEALQDAGLISGEEGQFGLYVKVVDGETLDYATDGKYWAFYVDGEYAPKGVDTTEIEAGKVYTFKPER